MKETSLGREFVGEKQWKVFWKALTRKLKILDSVMRRWKSFTEHFWVENKHKQINILWKLIWYQCTQRLGIPETGRQLQYPKTEMNSLVIMRENGMWCGVSCEAPRDNEKIIPSFWWEWKLGLVTYVGSFGESEGELKSLVFLGSKLTKGDTLSPGQLGGGGSGDSMSGESLVPYSEDRAASWGPRRGCQSTYPLAFLLHLFSSFLMLILSKLTLRVFTS